MMVLDWLKVEDKGALWGRGKVIFKIRSGFSWNGAVRGALEIFVRGVRGGATA
jgi:hypothetical protein